MTLYTRTRDTSLLYRPVNETSPRSAMQLVVIEASIRSGIGRHVVAKTMIVYYPNQLRELEFRVLPHGISCSSQVMARFWYIPLR